MFHPTAFFLTAHFSYYDYPYDWLMHWLSKVYLFTAIADTMADYAIPNIYPQQPAWGRSREFEITTRSIGRLGLSQSSAGDLEDDEDNDALVHGRKKQKITFLPSTGK